MKQWHRRVSIYSSSYVIENIEVEFRAGGSRRLVLKDLSPASLLATARRIRPHFLYHPLREIEMYQKVLNRLELGTPFFYGAVISAELERYWLFLERVEGPLLWQRGRMESWRQAAHWLARLHTSFDPFQMRDEPDLARLLRYDEEFLRMWLGRAEKFLRRNGSGAGAALRRQFNRLAGRYDRLTARLLALPKTLIHGEFYPSNVIMRQTGKGREICPVDWEMAAIAPGLIDLAALTSGSWTEPKRREMFSAYREGLESMGHRAPSMADLMESVDYCQLHIAVQLLGWACDWLPPERHAQNWLREAVRLGSKLGLLAS